MLQERFPYPYALGCKLAYVGIRARCWNALPIGVNIGESAGGNPREQSSCRMYCYVKMFFSAKLTDLSQKENFL